MLNRPPRPLDFRCPTCDARIGEECYPEGVTHIDRHAAVNQREADRLSRHQPDAAERARVSLEQQNIRARLAEMKTRGETT